MPTYDSTPYDSSGSFMTSSVVTQPPRPLTPSSLDSTPSTAPPRSPFVPVRKHRSTSPPPPATSPLPRSTRSTQMAPPPAPSRSGGASTTSSVHSSSAYTAGPPTTPLHQNSNIPNLTLQTASPRQTPLNITRKVLSSNSQAPPLTPTTAAPRLRAKITPAATPRRKNVLPGTENADIPVRHGGGGGGNNSPIKRAPPPLAAVVGPSYGAFPTTTRAYDDDYEGGMEEVQRGLNGLGLSSFVEMGLGGVNSSPTMTRMVRNGGSKGRDSVLVCVRVRPPAAKLAKSSQVIEERAWDVDEESGRVALKTGPSEFIFDSVVTGTENEEVYEEAGRDLVLAAMEGFDAVIFAYGQTASGKTFTLSGNAANPGIIPQAVTDIFSYIRDHPEKEFLLRASYLEIYNETLKDLLAPETGALKIRQDEKKRFFVHPLREEVVTGEAQVAALLRRGEENRSTGRTDFNERSSRSHSVFQMTIESRDETTYSTPDSTLSSSAATPSRSKTPNGPRLSPGGGTVRMSRLSLIDLAGSEQATSQTERRSEGAFINKSLLTLEKVIASLTDESKKKPHVPYRDSKLTQILQPSLAGDARVAVIATMNPSPTAIEETKSTLKFAQRVKKVTLKAVVNEIVDDKALIFKYRSHIAMLEAQLQAAMSQPSLPSTPSVSDSHTEDRNVKDRTRIKGLESQIEELRSLFVNSGNVEDRRQSMNPPRPVSPTKLRSPTSLTSDDADDLTEKLLDAQDEIVSLQEENSDLRSRLLELEQKHLQQVRSDASESAKDARIASLVQENQELLVVIKNNDGESELKKLEGKHRRMLEKRDVYEEALKSALEQEQQRVSKFERFILQHLATQADVLSGRRRSSLGGGMNGVGGRPSVVGMLPLMSESPDLGNVHEHGQLEIEDLGWSKEGRETIKRSGSMFLL